MPLTEWNKSQNGSWENHHVLAKIVVCFQGDIIRGTWVATSI